jgi:hypothetical protein
LLLIDNFGEAMGFKGKNNPVLVLDAKGGEIKGQSKKMDQLPLEKLENFENSRVRTFDLSKF